MKIVWTAVAVLCLVLILVGCNGLYVNRTVAHMEQIAADLPKSPCPEAVTQIQTLSKLVDKHTPWLCVSISFPLLDRVRELTDTLIVYANDGDPYEYAVSCALLSDALRDLKRLEKFGVESIL